MIDQGNGRVTIDIGLPGHASLPRRACRFEGTIMKFFSDNAAPVHPRIWAAMQAADVADDAPPMTAMPFPRGWTMPSPSSSARPAPRSG
jgi:hypothetical protein